MTGSVFAYNPILKQGILLEKVSQRYTCPGGGRKIKRQITYSSYLTWKKILIHKFCFLLSFHPPF